MDEQAKQNLYLTFKSVIDSIIEDKKKNPKNIKHLNKFEAKINLALQIEKDCLSSVSWKLVQNK